MTILALRIVKYMHGPNLRLGAVADIIPVGTSREKPAPTYLRGLVLPIGDPAVEPLTVSVEPGRYMVQATLPSGEILNQEIDAESSERVSVDLFSENSPHEWLGKLQVAGGVPSRRRLEARRSILGVVPVGRPLDVRASWLETVTSKTRFNEWLNSDAAVGDHAPQLCFGSLLAAGQLKSVSADEQFEKFEIKDRDSLGTQGPPSPLIAKLLGKGILSGQTRHYLGLEDTTGIRGLAVLPLPWRYSKLDDARAGQVMPIEIVLSESAPGSSFAESPVRPFISVDDPEVTGLLGYLGGRDLQSAEALLAQAVQWLYEKMMNPFAAAAGAYILLAADGLHGGQSKEWKSWIANLSNWFEWLPDGSIQLAWLKLNSISPEVDTAADGAVKVDGIVAEARGLLLRALIAGVPLFSAGVRLLVDALTLVANHEEYRGKHETPEGTATTRALMLARWLSRRTDPSQPFTAIRI
jgi:hypothetical protein